jgi:hypothetical protein
MVEAGRTSSPAYANGDILLPVEAQRQDDSCQLETDVFTTAQLRLPDKIKELRKPKAETGTFADGRLKYEAETHNGYTSKKKRLVRLAPLSIAYRLALPRMSPAHSGRMRCFIRARPGRN